MRESVVQRQILLAMRAEGAYAVVTIATGDNGTPDILGVYQGAGVGIEVKTGRRKPTPLQQQRIKEILQAGGRAGVARSTEEALAIMKGEGDGE